MPMCGVGVDMVVVVVAWPVHVEMVGWGVGGEVLGRPFRLDA